MTKRRQTTIRSVKATLDSKITFADFITLAAAFMACGALWWRVSNMEKGLNDHLVEARPMMQEFRVQEKVSSTQASDLAEVKKAVNQMQLDLAEIKGNLNAQKDSKR